MRRFAAVALLFVVLIAIPESAQWGIGFTASAPSRFTRNGFSGGWFSAPPRFTCSALFRAAPSAAKAGFGNASCRWQRKMGPFWQDCGSSSAGSNHFRQFPEPRAGRFAL